MPQLIDLDGIPEPGAGDYVKPGMYNVIADSIEERNWKRDYDKWVVRFVILEGSEANKVVVDTFFLAPNCLWRLKKMGKCMGLEMKGKKSSDILIEELRGKVVGIDVVDKEYNGNIRSSVNDFFVLDDDGKKKIAETEDIPF